MIVIFAGDSGDSMQLTGSQFTDTTALQGNDLATFPDFPAEIRAPAGTRAGVSGFQIHFSSSDIHTPGDAPGVLVAMNPAALVANVGDLKKNGLVIVNTDKFTARDLEKADLTENPLENGSLDAFQVVPVQLSKLTKASVKGLGLGAKESDRCKLLRLGMAYWLFGRDMGTPQLDRDQVRARTKKPTSRRSSRLELRRHRRSLPQRLQVPAAKLAPGTYRNITGNEALALGFVAAGQWLTD